jgi:hypothetical protein
MARPLGIEHPGAIYNVMCRGDWREASASALKNGLDLSRFDD